MHHNIPFHNDIDRDGLGANGRHLDGAFRVEQTKLDSCYKSYGSRKGRFIAKSQHALEEHGIE